MTTTTTSFSTKIKMSTTDGSSKIEFIEILEDSSETSNISLGAGTDNKLYIRGADMDTEATIDVATLNTNNLIANNLTLENLSVTNLSTSSDTNINGSLIVTGEISAIGNITSDGNVTASEIIGDTITQSSDKNLKQNIINLDSNESLKKILDINTYKYEFISNPQKTRYGVIAQELETKYPELVNKDINNKLSVNYTDMFVFLIGSIHEQQKMIENQNHTINELKSKIELIEKNNII